MTRPPNHRRERIARLNAKRPSARVECREVDEPNRAAALLRLLSCVLDTEPQSGGA